MPASEEVSAPFAGYGPGLPYFEVKHVVSFFGGLLQRKNVALPYETHL